MGETIIQRCPREDRNTLQPAAKRGGEVLQDNRTDTSPLALRSGLPIQRYHLQRDTDGLFLAQEERTNQQGQRTHLAENGKANIRMRGRSELRVADSGDMAIENGASENREAKLFYGTSAIQEASNNKLKEIGSPIRLGMAASNRVRATSLQGQSKVLSALFPIDVMRKQLGDDVRVPELCNEAAPHILNTRNANFISPHLGPGAADALRGKNTDDVKRRLFPLLAFETERQTVLNAREQNYLPDSVNGFFGSIFQTLYDAPLVNRLGIDNPFVQQENNLDRIEVNKNQIETASYMGLNQFLSGEDAQWGPLRSYLQQYADNSETRAGQQAMEQYGINEYAVPELGDMLSIQSNSVPADQREDETGLHVMDYCSGGEIKDPFPYHFASVVATSGHDYVTLENYARRQGGASNSDPRYFFQMYGPQEQSFHAELKADYPTPMTFTYRGQNQAQQVPEYDTDSPQLERMQQEYDSKLNRLR